MNHCEHPEGTAQMLRRMADLMETKGRDDKNTIRIELVDSDGDNIAEILLAELDSISRAINFID